jgi:hypothetical protein
LQHLKLLYTVHQTVAELSAKNAPSLYLKWLHSCKYLPSEHTPLLELILLRWRSDVSKEESEDIYVTLLKEFGTREVPNAKQKVIKCVYSPLLLHNLWHSGMFSGLGFPVAKVGV